MSTTEHKAKFTADNSDFNKKADQLAQKGNWLSNKIKAFGGAIAGAFAFQKIVQGIKYLININSDFEKSLASLSAITGAAGEDLKFYGESARELSKQSTYTANEVVEAYKLMGSARPELLKNKEALAAVAKEAIVLSEASGLDLRTATESLAKAMNQFNVPANEAARVINVLAAGSKEGAMEVPGLADAIRNMGTAAALANISLEDSVAMIETLAEKGMEGSKSGIMLRNVILKLQSGADNLNPKIVGMSVALENLATKNLTAAEMTEKFGIENYQAAAILIENRRRFEDLSKAITGTNTAYEQQEKMLDTLDSKWKIFKNTINDVALEAGGLVDKTKDAVDGLTTMIKSFDAIGETEALGFFGKLALKIGILTKDAGSLVAMTKILTAEELKAKQIAAELTAANGGLTTSTETVTEKEKIQVKTIADYKKEIDDLTESLDTLTIADGKRAEAIRNEIANIQALINKTLEYKTVIKTPAIAAKAPEVGGLLPMFSESEWQAMVDSINSGVKDIELAYTSAQEAAIAFGTEMMAAAESGQLSMKNFAQTAIEVAKKVIDTYIAEAVAAQIKIWVGTGPWGLALAGGAAAATVALFNSLVPKFAAGGAVSGPTLALVGEAPGISRSNPEYIGTAAQMGQMGMGGRTLSVRLSRGDLLFILNEGNASNINNF